MLEAPILAEERTPAKGWVPAEEANWLQFVGGAPSVGKVHNIE